MIVAEQQWLTTTEAAKELRVKPDKIRAWINSGELVAVDISERRDRRPRYRIAESSPRWRMHVYAQPSPWLNEAEMAKAELRDSRARFLRLWHGVWGSGVGDALDEADIPAAVDESLVPMTEGMPDVAYVGGLDLGIKHDHSAFVVLARETNTQRIRLARCLSWDPDPTTGKVDLEAVEAAVLAADQQFNLSACCDRSVNTISASSGSPAVRTSKHAFKFASSLDWGSIFFYDQRLAGAPDRQPGHWAIGPVL